MIHHLQSADHTVRTAPKILTALPNPDNLLQRHSPTAAADSAAAAAGLTSQFSMTIPNLLLSSALQFPDAGGSTSNTTTTQLRRPNPTLNHSRITLNLNYHDQFQEVRSEEWACVLVLG
jgi:hypothetical protein